MSLSRHRRSIAAAAAAALIAGLSISAIVPASATGAPVPAAISVNLTAPSKTGAFKAVASKTVWGGTKGRSLGAGKTVTLKLAKPRGVPASATSWLVQATTVGAKRAGTLSFGAAGSAPSADAAVAYPKGTASTSLVVRVSASRALKVQASSAVKLQVSATGYFTGKAGAIPGPGGTAAIAPHAVVDSAKAIGGAIPGARGTATVSVVGVGGVPAAGVRAVWVSAQVVGSTGSLAFFRADGGTSAAATVPIRSAWSTSLALAPLDSEGKLAYRVAKGTLKGLRLAVVGWVGETPATANRSTLVGGLVPVAAKTVSVKGSGDSLSAKVTGGAIPTKAARVWLRATVATKAAAGVLRAATTKAKAARSNATGVALPAKGAANILISAPVGADGRVYLAGPQGTRISGAAIVGYQEATVKTSVDRKKPSVTLAPPAGGAAIDLATTPSVALTGTVSDATSGVRSVIVVSGETVLGAARVDATVKPARWTLNVAVPVGTSALIAVAEDNAGRRATASQTVTTQLAPDATVVSPEVEVLPADVAARITEITPESLVIAGVTDAAVGDVLVIEPSTAAPDGMLCRVTGIEVISGNTYMSTEYAGLEDAILQADIEVDDAPIGAGDVSDGGSDEIVQAESSRSPMGKVEFGGSVGDSTTLEAKLSYTSTESDPTTGKAVSVSVSGKAGIKIGAKLEAKIKVSWPSILVYKGKVDLFSVIFKQEQTVYVSYSA
ncbi:MAG: hypothetical protein LBJ08_07805, partial [Bifidobacteriaceae bacterium]|nr:hypothetical protein [Bifidobacteriaceae bacterium]